MKPVEFEGLSGRPVDYFVDRLDGVIWMAESPWSLFRVRSGFNDLPGGRPGHPGGRL